MLNLSSGKVLTPQCVLWLAAQMKVFKSLSLVMEFFFTTNLVFTMCYLIPPNHIFTSLHFILFHPILFQPIPFYLLLFHLNPSFPIHFYSSSSHLFSLIQSQPYPPTLSHPVMLFLFSSSVILSYHIAFLVAHPFFPELSTVFKVHIFSKVHPRPCVTP